MKKNEFIELMEDFLCETGLSEGSYNAYISVGDERDINTSVYIDEENQIWITGDESIKRVKTSVNVDNIVELRYSQFGSDAGRFFVICSDNSGLDFCEGEIGFFVNGYYGSFKNAIDWFTDNPVN